MKTNVLALLTCCLSSFFASFLKTSGLSTWTCSEILFTTGHKWKDKCLDAIQIKFGNRSGRGRTWLNGLRFRFACGRLLARLNLLAQLGGPLGLLPGSSFRLQLCFALGWFVNRGRRFGNRHGSESRHCWGSCETQRTPVRRKKRQLLTCSDQLRDTERVISHFGTDSDVNKELLVQAEDNLNSTLPIVTSSKAGADF